MSDSAAVTIETLRAMLAENVMLKIDASSIDEETPLFGAEGLGLDSLDALQIIIAVEKKIRHLDRGRHHRPQRPAKPRRPARLDQPPSGLGRLRRSVWTGFPAMWW
ncbi:MAG: acyl carrier protein [Verrucomicrobiota bacterium]